MDVTPLNDERAQAKVSVNTLPRKILRPKRMQRRLDKNAQCRASRFVRPTDYHPCDRLDEDEMGRACGTYGGQHKHIQGFGGET
jgi:hypothetical protein